MTFTLRIYKVTRPSSSDVRAGKLQPTVQPKRLPDVEIEASNLASAKKVARAKLDQHGHRVRSISYGAHNDLIVLVED